MDAAARLRELSDLATPWAVWIATTLGLPDHIEAGATTLEPLAEAAGADPDALRRLLALLVARGVLAESDGVYANTEVSALLVGGGWRSWFDLDGAPAIWAASWPRLLQAVRTGSPGRDEGWYYEELARTGRGEHFDELMAAQVRANAERLAEAYDWSGVGHVVDLGGGTGTLVRTLLAAHPHLRGTLYERPQVAAGVEPEERLEVVAGDLLVDPLPAADVYVLSQILHGWPDPGAEAILARCAAAAPRVLVVEGVQPERPSADEASFDLFMLTLSGGRQRTLADFRRLGAVCGLALVGESPLAGGVSLVQLAREPPPRRPRRPPGR
ncbi:MAG TPA: methyltransferase [Gaiellaceae bacterium]|nr:methyltransferase [Gaiellaceae bacterium]